MRIGRLAAAGAAIGLAAAIPPGFAAILIRMALRRPKSGAGPRPAAGEAAERTGVR